MYDILKMALEARSMKGESLKGLKFRSFQEIPDFNKKLTAFLNSLDEELETWRDYIEKRGKRSIPHRITGYACLDGEKIIAIYYFFVPKKLQIRNFINLLFVGTLKMAEAGSVVKREYQGCGIGIKLFNLTVNLAREMGYKRLIYVIDCNNIAALKLAEKQGCRILRITNKKKYFIADLDDSCHDRTRAFGKVNE
jgi:RimJ/RimL family protein N-acetyltransferase